jgi:phosphate transport system permease protein
LERLFFVLCAAATLFGLLAVITLTFGIFRDGWSVVDWQFITSFPSRFAEKAGIASALAGTLWLMAMTAVLTVPLGIGTAVYLEEFAPKNRLTNLIQINIANLAGVPSIVYALLGLTIFVRMFEMGRSILAGSLTMSLLILPMVIAASQEAIRAVPSSYREGSLALGATRWETTRHHILPQALPGILTGIILGLSRAIGEAAPLITIGAATFINFLPKSPSDAFTVLPIQIFNWASDPRHSFHKNAAGAIIVLMAALLLFNALAILLRNAARKKLSV